ncbi:MAG TPA: DinB family protein [Bryobacteraceae bacterium]|nr:DinB family protein [Bryobacteraceae bacterium]
MEFQIPEAVRVLERTPAVMDSLLRGQSPAWLNARIDPDSFTPVDVLGHLILGELTDWIPRVRIILEHQDSRAFDPFDRRGFTSLIANKPVAELLDQFADLRRKNLQILNSFALDGAQLDLPGKHPGLGPVTMRQLLATWVVHDLNHLDQVMRILSNQYRDAVGPWREYLSIVT